MRGTWDVKEEAESVRERQRDARSVRVERDRERTREIERVRNSERGCEWERQETGERVRVREGLWALVETSVKRIQAQQTIRDNKGSNPFAYWVYVSRPRDPQLKLKI